MWHASIATHGLALTPAQMERHAMVSLAGVGDHRLGQWVEHHGRYVHVRRRLRDRDLAELPAEHRQLVDVRTSHPLDLAELIAPVIASQRSSTVAAQIRFAFLDEIKP